TLTSSKENRFNLLDDSAAASTSIIASSGATFDFGDAPNSYHTSLTSNGPRHRLGSGGLFLGKAVDGEKDGKPSATATGDSDDGVMLPTSLVAGLQATAKVVASAAGRLDAWVDFNRNGIFDAGEQIAISLPLAAGTNTV